MKRSLLLLCICVQLAGCSALDREGAKVNKFGPQSLLQQPVDVPDLVSIVSNGKLSNPVDPQQNPQAFTKKLDEAMRLFYAEAGSADEVRQRRNRVQDRLVLASNDACEAFKTVLKRKQADRNFEFGTSTVLFGTAGAISRVANTAKAFSALAGASAGIHAEYNRDYFADVAAHVITKALSKRRQEVMLEIAKGQAKPIGDYSLESAIGDAVTYHGACTLVGGLEYADGAVGKLDPSTVQLGLDVMQASQKTATEINAAAPSKK